MNLFRPHPASGAPRSQDEVDAGSGTGGAERSLPLHMERALFKDTLLNKNYEKNNKTNQFLTILL